MKKNKKYFIANFLFIFLLLESIIFYGNQINLEKAHAETKGGASHRANILSSGNDEKSDVANDAVGNFVVTWKSNTQSGDPDNNGEGVYFQFFNNIGEAQLPTPEAATDQLVNTGRTAGNQSDPAVAMDANGNFIIVWSDDTDGYSQTYDVYAQAYNSSGSPIGTAIKVNSAVNQITPLPDIALDYNGPASGNVSDFVVVWQQSSDRSFSTNDDIHMRRMQVNFVDETAPTFSSDETTVGTDTAQHQDRPQVAMNTDGEFMITWFGQNSVQRLDQIWYQAFNSSGSPIGESIQVNSNNVNNGFSPHITTDKKNRTRFDDSRRNYIIAYQGDTSEDSSGIFARQIFCTDADPTNGSDDDITCALNSVELNVNSSTTGFQVSPDVNADYLGNFTVTWEDQNNAGGLGKNIYAQSYRYNDGSPYGAIARFGTEFRVNNVTIGDQTDPSIAMNEDGTYLITYSDASDGPSTDVIFQQYISDLFKNGVETLANSSDSVTQTEADVAVAPDGRHAAVWHGLSPNGIYFTLWDADGNIVVQDVRVDNDGAINDHANPTIAFYKDTNDNGSNVGRFVIAWSGSVPTCGTDYANAGTDIWYREVGPTGALNGSCERKAHPMTASDGNDTYPQIAAGYYNNDGGPVEDNFTIIYSHQEGAENFIQSTFHSGVPGFITILSDFTVNILSTACTGCASFSSVALNPLNNRIIYAWSQIDLGSKNGIFIREASMGYLLGDAPQRINLLMAGVGHGPGGGTTEEDSHNPAVAWLPNNQFIVTYTSLDISLTSSNIWATRHAFNTDTGVSDTIDAPFQIPRMLQATPFQTSSNAASDLESGTFMVTWVNSPVDASPVDKIFGQLYKYNSAENGGIQKFGSVFTINSTKTGFRNAPSVDMDQTGRIIVGWEGNFEDSVGQSNPGSDDSEGVIIQKLLSPLYAEQYPELQPEVRQEVSGGGRTLNVPDTMEFPETIVTNPDAPVSVEVSVRNNTLSDPVPLQYVEFEDLEGAPAVITVSAQNFVRTSDHQSYISVTNFSVKNCDEDLATDERCKVTVNGNPADINLSSVDTADNDSGIETFYPFISEVEQKTLVTKSGNNLGKWRIFPKFKLEIPPTTPPGNHTTVITFSLT